MANRYNAMTIWENRSQLRILKDFRLLIEEYSANLTKGSWMADFAVSESKRAREIRPAINRAMRRVSRAVTYADHNPILVVTYPPNLGGMTFRLDVIADFLYLHQHRGVSEQKTFDALDVCIGVYETDYARAWARTLNPLFWANRAIDWVASLPFALISKFGGNRERAEASKSGRVLKAVLSVTQWVALMLTILQLLGLLDRLTSQFRNLDIM